jgi:chromosome partitioning protein
MTHIIAVSNQKGGVGKTTCTRELGIFLASAGKTVLVIDADPQGNLTKSLLDEPEPGLYEALTGASFNLPLGYPGMHILSGDIRLALLEKSLIGEMDAYIRVKELLSSEVFSRFDYILFDTPPSLGVLTINALTAARHVVIPMNPSMYSMQGTNDLISSVMKVKKNFNPGLTILGVVINAFDSIPVITRQIREEIHSSFGELVFNTVLSKSIKVEEAIAGKTGLINTNSKLKGEVVLLGTELMIRVGDNGEVSSEEVV